MPIRRPPQYNNLGVGGRAGDANIISRKACNCRNSKCLKLYCECFASGLYCITGHCNCNPCQNNPNFEELRQQAVQQTLEKNPTSFRPKINSSQGQKGGA